MPIHEYLPATDASCAYCEAGFERLQKLHEPALGACPHCHAPVTRQLSAPHTVAGGDHVLKESNLARHGFTQYKRIGKGQYEKTVGRGPSHISDS